MAVKLKLYVVVYYTGILESFRSYGKKGEIMHKKFKADVGRQSQTLSIWLCILLNLLNQIPTSAELVALRRLLLCGWL